MRATSARLIVGRLREVSTIGVVSALSAAYGTTLFGASDILKRLSASRGGSAGAALDVVAAVFIMIALFVAAIVIAGGVDTVIAGRLRQLTLLRLIGADSRQLRAGLLRAVVRVATLGALVGVACGAVILVIVRAVLRARDQIPAGHYAVVPAGAIVVTLAVVATAAAATVIGARRPLGATALRGAAPVRSGLRGAVAAITAMLGAAMLAAACVLGERGSLAGFGFAFFGAATVGVGVLLGARLFLPRLVTATARLGGNGPAALVARKNAVSDPARTSRSTVGLLIGVTLITTIAAGMNALERSVRSWHDLTPAQMADTERLLSATSAVLIALIAISAVIAGVGFVSTMSLTVIARTREIGMLRAMGFTAQQVRAMISLESLALSGTAALAGLGFGLIFGSVGSQSLVGSVTSGFELGLPWPALVGTLAATAVLVLLASLPPSRRAVAIAPTEALAMS
ncbi:FtsX-like permease family protein [Gordonia sp. PP30]|uniref:ABC transporter permease n=1 Tax=Gordonia sp. PP30 TaxID=2935861 RepID=UPI0020004C8F|nr:FtsX-like permease family protein [Gordonia sp. PP30]UQE74463.1 FtsX-like permease family protein [Gordonia sp. PP30]